VFRFGLIFQMLTLDRKKVLQYKSMKRFLVILAVGLMFTACDPTGDSSGCEGGTCVVDTPSEVLPPLTTPDRTICDPFGTHSAVARDRGVVGNLAYLSDEMPRYKHARDYVDYGHLVQSTLYMDRIMIPTRAFDLGFTTQQGETIMNSNGQPMYEYFGLKLEGQLQLGVAEADGPYQLALLSDDGAVLYQKNSDGSLVPIIDNDGDHATRMACATQPVNLVAGQKFPFQLEYYQGPRYHISLVVMWRPWTTDAEAECGQSGNSRYFDSTVVPSKWQPLFYDMLTRGWKPLENENFYFPAQASNPCVPPEAPLTVTGYSVTSTRTSVTASFVTSVNSFGQVHARNVATGAETASDVDVTAGTNHTIALSGLSANTVYAVWVTSTSVGGQTAKSDERGVRTPR
jgi:hypothetical protein